jgi:hypothetical protein
VKTIDFNLAFGRPGEHEDRVSEYIHDLRENWKSTEETFNKTILLVTILAVAFVLVGNKGVDDVVIGGIKITNLKLS